MNTKYLFTAIAIVVVVVVGFLLMNQSGDQNEVSNQTNEAANLNTNTDANVNTNAVTNSNANQNTNTPVVEEPTEPDGNDVAVFEVVYDGQVFNPSTVSVKTGDVVIFKNDSNGSFWPASGPHPQHSTYPEFDPKRAIGAGQTWQFKFTKVGSWSYHNHLNESATGKVIVE